MITHLTNTRTDTTPPLVDTKQGDRETARPYSQLRVDNPHRSLTMTQGWSDDPVCQYLRQIGRYPLLTRQQEIDLAKRVELTRRRFRRSMLECDFVLRKAVDLLKSVQAGELSFQRIVQVSVSDRLEEHQIRGRLPHNLKTLDALLSRNRHDFQIATRRTASSVRQRDAWRRLIQRRRRAVRLVEELGLRLEFIEASGTH